MLRNKDPYLQNYHTPTYLTYNVALYHLSFIIYLLPIIYSSIICLHPSSIYPSVIYHLLLALYHLPTIYHLSTCHLFIYHLSTIYPSSTYWMQTCCKNSECLFPSSLCLLPSFPSHISHSATCRVNASSLKPDLNEYLVFNKSPE